MIRVGIDLGGTKIEGIALDEQGNVLVRHRVMTPQGDYQKTVSETVKLIKFIQESVDDRCTVGIGMPGSLSTLTGKMKNCNSRCLNGQFFKEDVEHLLKQSVRIANDANCFALSEAVDGAAKEAISVFGVILGTGVGGGVVINKKLISGPQGIAGEWGHNPLCLLDHKERRMCYCGRFNCVETFLSGPAFEQDFYQRTQQSLAAAEIVQLAEQGNQYAFHALENYKENLARALAVVINILEPDTIVLGGGMSNIQSLYQDVPKRLLSHVFSDQLLTTLVAPQYNDSSGVRGAAWLWQ